MAEQITFYITGTEDTVGVPCVPGMLTDSDRLLPGGFESGAVLAVNVRTSHFISADMTEITADSIIFTADNSTARPRVSKECLFRGKRYRIATCGEDATRAYVHVTLADAKAKK
jgi:hypothetical protein